jgi:RNA polymerase sigma factor (sigma-70 family)
MVILSTYEVQPQIGSHPFRNSRLFYFWAFLNKLRHVLQLDFCMSENELVSRLKSRDRRALEYLYDHYSGAIYGVINRIVRTESVSEEVLQDVFLRIWDRMHDYDPNKGRLFTWMLRIARNQAIDKTRSKELMNERKSKDLDNFVDSTDSATFVEQKTESIGVAEILNDLSAEQKFVVEYLYFKGYSQSELAEEFNIPLGTVKTRLRLAMKELRSLIKVV